ncbi:MAG: gephyrin-like molybdotransferase Glp [Betaproteobacteria bacterium]
MREITSADGLSPRARITGLVLAGGLSRRMQVAASGQEPVDKALIPCAGKPLIAWTLQRLQPQVDELLINCNRRHEVFAAMGHQVLGDKLEGFAGPLAGMHAALHELAHRPQHAMTAQWLLTVPCDCPFFPEDLAQSMLATAKEDSELVVARSAEAEQPVFLLMRPTLLASLEHFLKLGLRKIDQWYQSLNYVSCEFDEPLAFRNINTPEDLIEAACILGSPHLDIEGLAKDIQTLESVQFKGPSADLSQAPESIPMIPIEALRKVLLDRLRPLERSQWLSLADLRGQVLTQSLISPYNVPAHQNSAMDGFAIRFMDLGSDVEMQLPVGERILAGHPNPKPPPAHPHALRVMTGAVLPEGFDVVVPQELCKLRGDRVVIPAGQQRGQHVRLAGEDIALGDRVIESGTRLSAIHMGLMASLGIAQARVRGPLRVAILSTGDEVLDPMASQERTKGRLFDSNRFMLKAFLAKWPSIAIHDAGIIPDDPNRLEQTLRELSHSQDMIISSGGVSVGEADFTRSLMARLGQVHFCTVAMRPGRPLALGRIGKALYFGLPGNPVAVAMTFWYFVVPAIDRLLGLTTHPWPLRQAVAAQAIRKKPGRTEFQRARLETDQSGMPKLSVSPNQGSGVLSSLTKYPAIAVLEHDRGHIKAGESLFYVCIDDLL